MKKWRIWRVRPEGCLWCRCIFYWKTPADTPPSASERTSWTETTLNAGAAPVSKDPQSPEWSPNERSACTHRACSVRRCAGQRRHSGPASAPRKGTCTASPDTLALCAPTGNESCCGRASLTSTWQRDQPGQMEQELFKNDMKRNCWFHEHKTGRWPADRQKFTLDPHGRSFFQGVKFSVQTISRGRVA